ncbi:MAG: GEVED domain-containing protein [Pontiellaceae bacterium]|nr:GEVED domain-containing protein [Pontiellaceae bacterium]
MKRLLMVIWIVFGTFITFAGPVRPIRSSTFQSPQPPCGPVWDSFALQGQWFQDPLTQAVQVKTWEFHDDDAPLSIEGIVQSITFDGTQASNIVAFTVKATVVNNLPSTYPQMVSSNSHNEVQNPLNSTCSGIMKGARIAAEFAIASTTNLPNGVPPYYTDPVSGGVYFIEAVNEHEWAWYCWTHDGNFQVPTWILGDIPPGGSASVLMQFQITGGVMPMSDYRHSVIRYSRNNQADLLYNRHTSLKISHWLDTLLIDNGTYIGAPSAPPGQYIPEPPEYIYASDASVFFDLEMDFGDAPDPSYPTLLLNDGARHIIAPGVFLGNLIDPELDGQPSPNALGDDINNLPDEDGVIFTSMLIPGRTASVDVICSTNGFLSAWIDFNGNGTWGDAADQIFMMQPVVPGTNSLNFPVSPAAVSSTTFARFRFTTKPIPPLNFLGLAEDGEVEDYQVQIQELDFGDAWDSLSAPAYPVLVTNNGARHIIASGVFLGAGVDSDTDGQPDLNARGDDQDLVCPLPSDIPFPPGDEDGVVIPSPLIAGSTVTVQVIASVPGYLNAWIDWNANQSWIDAGEQVYTNQALVPGINNLTLNVPVPPALVSGGPHSRWRFTTYVPATPSYAGQESDGEVEDYEVKLETLDFGDAPAPYPVLYINNGARHLIPSAYWLGAVPPDHEPEGQPDAQALGDDSSGTADEDGVTVAGPLLRGSNTTVYVTASTNGILNAWIDFNRNGSWSDTGEQIATNLTLSPGTNSMSVAVPTNASPGKTFGRFRFSSYTGLQPTGVVYDGEAEDYVLTVCQTPPSSDIVITNLICDAGAGTLKIEWQGESPVVYELQYADALGTGTVWTAAGTYILSSPYEQTFSIATQTSRFYRVSAPACIGP